jgi:hypothetical protein
VEAVRTDDNPANILTKQQDRARYLKGVKQAGLFPPSLCFRQPERRDAAPKANKLRRAHF